MRFLVDVNLPEALARWISENGHDCIHTLDLEKENDTQDNEIVKILELDPRIFVSKDPDFFKSFLLRGNPKQLLFITTGNIKNQDLIFLFQRNFPKILTAFEQYKMVELSSESIIIHS